MTNEERQQAIEWLKRRPVMMAGAKRIYDLAVEALEAYVPDMNVRDMISRQAAIDAVLDRMDIEKHGRDAKPEEIRWTLEKLPSAQPETCEGCKHLGKWENEVEYGYPSPCTRCKRRAEDRYEK